MPNIPQEQPRKQPSAATIRHPDRPDPDQMETDAVPPRRARWRWLLLPAIPLLVAAGLVAGLWAGWRHYEQPFVWYNLNRIDAMADRAARMPDSVTVAALGDVALRDATLDEADMAALAAKRGIKRLHFLRIVHHQAEFADFEPLLDRLLAIRPALVLIDRDLLITERGVVADLTRYFHILAGAYEGRPYLQDQTALQYRRACGARTADEPAPTTTMATPVAAPMAAPTAAKRVRAFITRAWSAGIPVALVQLRSRPGSVVAASDGNPPLWHYAQSAESPDQYCPGGAQGPEGRRAFSAWLAGNVANALATPRREPRTEAAALP